MNELQSVKISLDKLKSIECENCKCKTFSICYELKLLPALLSANNQAQIISVPIFHCDDCGKIVKNPNNGTKG